MNFRAYLTAKKNHPYWRRVGILSAGTMVSHALLFCSFPVVGLLYSPSQFGEYALYGALLAFLGIVATLRYEMAIPIASNRRAAISLLSLALIGSALFSILVRIVGSSLKEAASRWFSVISWDDLIAFLAIGCAAEGCVRTLRAWNLRQSDMSALATAKVAQSMGVVACQLLFVPLGHIGLYLSDVVGRTLAALSHWFFAWQRKQLPSQRSGPRSLARVATRYRRYPLYSTWATLCIQFVDCSPLILLSLIYGSAAAGSFALAHRAVLGPLLFISMAMTQAYVSVGAEKIRECPLAFTDLFWKTWKRMLIIGGVSVLLTAGLGGFLVRFLLEEQWYQASMFMLLLAPAVFGQFVVGPVYQTLDLLQEQKWAIVVNGLGMFLVIGIFSCAKIYLWPVTQSVAIYSGAVLAYNACLFICAARAVRRFHVKQEALLACRKAGSTTGMAA